MTESNYLANTTRPAMMLAFAGKRVRPRKVQLMAVGFCRLLGPDVFAPPAALALAALDGYATGRVTDSEFVAARVAVEADSIPFVSYFVAAYSPADWATLAVASAVNVAVKDGASRALNTVCRAAESVARRNRQKQAIAAVKRRACDIVREIAGNPFRPWAAAPAFLGGGLVQPDGVTVRLTDAALGLARAIDAGRFYDRLPILADALEEAGVTDAGLLDHCRAERTHLPGCWALDVVLGRG